MTTIGEDIEISWFGEAISLHLNLSRMLKKGRFSLEYPVSPGLWPAGAGAYNGHFESTCYHSGDLRFSVGEMPYAKSAVDDASSGISHGDKS
jgi:hypothetical protein